MKYTKYDNNRNNMMTLVIITITENSLVKYWTIYFENVQLEQQPGLTFT